MRFYRIASLDGGGGGWNTEGEYKVKKKKKKKEKKKEHPYKMEDYHVAFFEKENHLV